MNKLFAQGTYRGFSWYEHTSDTGLLSRIVVVNNTTFEETVGAWYRNTNVSPVDKAHELISAIIAKG